MNHHYRDIRERLGAPQWWDEAGVPRYCDFSPNETNDIYARQAILMEIACQNCGQRFRVAMTVGPLGELVTDVDALHYGDPPNAGCCLAGPTMNSVPVQVLEWAREECEDTWSSDYLVYPSLLIGALEREILAGWTHDEHEGRERTQMLEDEVGYMDAWEWNLRTYDWSFLWCCWAIVRGIEQYRAAERGDHG